MFRVTCNHYGHGLGVQAGIANFERCVQNTNIEV
jgi:hypothetical protein